MTNTLSLRGIAVRTRWTKPWRAMVSRSSSEPALPSQRLALARARSRFSECRRPGTDLRP
eukprot:690527-Prymnesium_polylepis.1